MAKRTTTMLIAGAFGLAALAPGGAAAAQTQPPRDPNPPAYDHHYDHHYDHRSDGGCYHDDGYYDQQGKWHDGYHDRQGRWDDSPPDERHGHHGW
jgi:hypothetical protein